MEKCHEFIEGVYVDHNPVVWAKYSISHQSSPWTYVGVVAEIVKIVAFLTSQFCGNMAFILFREQTLLLVNAEVLCTELEATLKSVSCSQLSQSS